MKHLPVILVTVATLLTGCSPTPNGVIPPEPMARLIADMEIGESVVQDEPRQYPTDSVKMVFMQSIYRKHDVTSEQVDSSLAWYGAHIEQYKKVYDRVVDILNDRLKEARTLNTGKIAETLPTQDGDSINVWTAETSWRFISGKKSDDIITFRIPRDHNFEPGDAYELSFKLIGGNAIIHTVVAAEYTDGTTDYVPHQFSGQGWHSVTLPLDSTTSASNIFGSIGVETRDKGTAYLDSVSLVRMRNKQSRRLKSTFKYHLSR